MTAAHVLVYGPLVLLGIVIAILVPLALRIANVPALLFQHAISMGLLAAGSLWLDPGTWAIVLVAPYAGICVWAGGLGLWRIFEMVRAPSQRSASAFVVAAGLAFLPGAAVWLVAHRAGHALLGFPLASVALTAAHFHVAGAILAIVVGRAAQDRGWLAGAIAVACVVAVPLTAIGIQASQQVGGEPGMLERVGSLAMVGSALGAAVVVGTLGRRAFVVAAGSLAIAMLLAGAYALRLGIALCGLDPLATMIASHAVLNVFGFSLVALLALDPARTEHGSQ